MADSCARDLWTEFYDAREGARKGKEGIVNLRGNFGALRRRFFLLPPRSPVHRARNLRGAAGPRLVSLMTLMAIALPYVSPCFALLWLPFVRSFVVPQ